MATRFYFPAATAADVSPAFETWGSTADALRRKLVATKGLSAITTGTTINVAAGDTGLDRQYVSDPMAAGIVFTLGVETVALQLMVREFGLTQDIDQALLFVKIVSLDGATKRVDLLGGPAEYGPTTEFINNATCRNKTFADGDLAGNTYTTVAGDRLVVEIGYGAELTGLTPTAAAKWGENATDLPANETQTTNGAGWIEFSTTITFAGTCRLQPQALVYPW